MTRDQVLDVARALAVEYAGQAEREGSDLRQIVAAAKASAMDDLVTRVLHLEAGEPPAPPLAKSPF